MVDSIEESGFWLPPEFLDDLIIDEKVIGNKSKKNLFDTDFCFPSEFPYESNGDEKSLVMSTSPQSTLTRLSSFSEPNGSPKTNDLDLIRVNGSPNGVNSPPMTPLTHSVEDLIHRAVGQVARLKLNGVDGPGLIYPKPHIGQPRDLQQAEMEKHGAVWYGHREQQIGPDRKITGQVSWSGPTRITRSGVVGLSNHGIRKKTCAGTGVFLPRRYDNDDKVFSNSGYSPDHGMKTGYAYASGLTCDRNVHKQHMAKMDHYNANVSIKSQPRLANYEMLIARRNALMLQHHQQQQQRSSMMLLEDSSLVSRGIYLPQEWTY